MELLNQFAPSWAFGTLLSVFGCVFQGTTLLIGAKEVDVAGRVPRTKVNGVDCSAGHINGQVDALLAEILCHVLESEDELIAIHLKVSVDNRPAAAIPLRRRDHLETACWA